MKNIQGTEDKLELFNENGIKVYEYFKNSYGYIYEYTYDSQGKELTYKNSDGFSCEYTRDSNGKELTYKDSDGFNSEYAYDSQGKVLTYKNSNGFSYEYTRDSNGKELTYKDSDGVNSEYTYDSNGKELTYKNSNGFSCEYTRDSQGKELTYKNSDGVSRGFDKTYTLEEAAEYYVKMQYPMGVEKEYPINDFIEGAKWQAERMYSEEDLLSAFEAGMMFIGEDKGSFKEWFEQFKKK